MIILSLVSACGNLPVRDPQTKPAPRSPNQAIDEARTLKQKGSWSQAIATLEEANDRYPENDAVLSELNKLERAWKHEKRLLEDRMLVSEMASLREKIPLLETLSQGEPNNVLYRSRLLFWQNYLQARVDSLVACGIYHGKTHLNVAQLCLVLANEIAPSEETKELLYDVAQSIEKQKYASTSRKAVQETRKRKREVKNLLAAAKKANRQGAHRDALVKLEEALRQDPENAEARRLRSNAQSTLNQQVESLVRLGDRLYSEEQILPAVAMWESALELDPGQDEIGERIDRARRVLEKLEAIRSRE
jgi:tetratricopeptide (TPR) repeat protein